MKEGPNSPVSSPTEMWGSAGPSLSKPALNLKGLLTRTRTPTIRSPGTHSGASSGIGNHGNQIESFLSKLVDKVDDTQLDPNSFITVDICGKLYEILNSQLFMNPDSLLASPEREQYLDPDTGFYFFDRNRQAFEQVFYYGNRDYHRGSTIFWC